MTCPACSHQNLPGAKFCVECGSALKAGCVSCGVTLTPNARFCHECGTPVAGAAPRSQSAEPAGARKIVSILFADLVGSTALHERLDPESTRRFMESYYDVARKAVESHGGKVTQFLGDGVKAVFGVPRIAEDDAIRAVRAAVAMQEGFKALAEQQRLAVGTTGLRVAVNTGEVIAEGETEVIGDPVNVAARLQEHGKDGDVVIGESTEHLVATQVTLELLGAFDLKGRSGTVKAYRVVSLESQHAKLAPFVGREKELKRITAVYDQALETPTTKLAVLLGSAGLGKSRMIGEFARCTAATATVIQAHCDAAKGTTFAPLADAFRKHLALDADASTEDMQTLVEAVLKDDDEHTRITRGIVGLLNGLPSSPEETFFVIRRFLAALTGNQPVVLIIDDLQWAEPLLFDLVEHLVQWGRDLPLMLLIGARPELREIRSAFGKSGGFVTDALTLDGLDASASMQLAAGVIGADELPAAVAAKVLATSEGNPLFISELIRMLVVEGAMIEEDGVWRAGDTLTTVEMPPTIHALLASRIERLEPLDCAILERASVIGRQFSRNAVTALLPNDPAEIDARLEALQRAELIERGTGWYIGDPVLRFHHVLIRDAAYRRLLKGTRAELHAKLADWVEAQVGDAHEHDETIGRHLEDAHRLLGELGPLDEAGEKLGERAATRLASAGRRALEADDVPLAAGLLGRALERLRQDDPGRADLCIDWCESLLAEGEVSTAQQAIDELGRLMENNERLQAWHQCFVGQHTVLTAPRELTATVTSVSAAAQKLANLEDSAGEAKAHYVHALALSRQGQIGACEAALDQALAAARKANDRRQANTVLAIAPIAALWGPSPVTRASGRCLDVVRVLRITQGAPAVEAVALMCQGVLEALRGRSEAAHRMIESGREMVEELGIAPQLRNADAFTGYVHLLEGDLTTAEAKLRSAYEGLRDLGLGIDAARAAALLAKTLLSKGEIEEAKTLSHESEQLAGDDLKAAIAWRGVRAEALAGAGEHDDAIKLARKAVSIAEKTDALLDHADARQALAVALRASGQTQEANTEEQRARKLWEDKGAALLLDQQKPIKAPINLPDEVADRPRVSEGKRGLSPISPVSPISPERIVQQNLASEMLARYERLVAAQDWDAVRGCYHDNLVVIDHPTGATYGADQTTKTLEMLFRSDDAYFRTHPIATLGDNLCLFRRESGASSTNNSLYDVGPYEGLAYRLTECDEQGLWLLNEVFAENKLGDAIACLYERYAESLPDGPQRERALTIARSIKWTLTDDRSISMKEAISPDMQGTDHRPLVGHETVGHYGQKLLEMSEELIQNLKFHHKDVIALAPDVLLRATCASGTWKGFDSGEGELDLLMLSVFGADGRQTQLEWFEPSQKEQALARFNELTSGESAVSVSKEDARFLYRLRPGVHPNHMTASGANWVAALAAGNPEREQNGLHEDIQELDHATGSDWGREGIMGSAWRLIRSREPFYQVEALATLGSTLALSTRCYGATGGRSQKYDVGAYEIVRHEVMEGGEDGIHRMESFAEDKLGDAIARMFELYVESLPEGPERDKAANIVSWAKVTNGQVDADRYIAHLADDIVAHDRRTAGYGERSGKDAVSEALIVLMKELTKNFHTRLDDIYAWTLDAGLIRSTSSGIEKRSGGEFERCDWHLCIFDEEGYIQRWEQFNLGDREEAIARFHELTGGESAVPAHEEPSVAVIDRIVRPNLASTKMERYVAAVNAREFEAARALFRDDYVEVHHPTGLSYGADENIRTWKGSFRNSDPYFYASVIATLGDFLCLTQSRVGGSGGTTNSRFEVGAYELRFNHLVEGDEQGLAISSEIFADNKLGDAVARLFERYAKLLPDGVEKTRASGIAKFWRASLGPPDLEGMGAQIATDVRFMDHRTVGMGQQSSPEQIINGFRVLTDELTEQLTVECHELLGLTLGGTLNLIRTSGKDRKSGGDFERMIYELILVNDEGKVHHWERFDENKGNEALARFEELTGGELPSSVTEEKVDITIRPGVQPNEMTNFMTDFVAALKQRDFDWLRRMFTDSYREIDHPTGSTIDKAGTIASLERLFRSEEPYYQVEVLATLGESLQLGKHVFGASSAASKNFDVGAYENVRIQIDDREEGCEVFDTNHLADAIIRLYERYAKSLSEGPDQAKAQGLANIIRAGTGSIDPERLKPFWSDNVQLVDYRTAGMGTIEGADAVTEAISVMVVELTEDFAGQFDEVISLKPDALLAHYTTGGKGQLSGGDFEQLAWYIMIADEQGKIARWEIFEEEQAEKARTRFEELAGPQQAEPTTDISIRSPRPPVPENSIAKLMRQVFEAGKAQDWDTIRNVLGDEYQEHHHPTDSIFGVDEHIASIQRLYKSNDPYYEHELVAVLGDSLALGLMKAGASGASGQRYDVGAYEQHFYVLMGMDRKGEIFAENKLGEALARLYERYAESLPEGPGRKTASAISTFIKLGLVWNLKEVVALLAPDIQYVDHRHAGVGELNSPDALINIGKVLKEDLTNNLQVRIEDVLRIQPNAFLWYYVDSGTDKRSGGDFERHVWDVIVFNDEGLVSHWDRFEHEHKDRALARFEELTGDTKPEPVKPIIQPNLATEATKHALKTIVERNWEAGRAYLHDDLVETDHTNGVSIGPDQMMSSVQLLFHGDNPVYHIEPLATLGPHLMLALRKISSSGAKGKRFDVGEYENTTLHLAEYDDESRMCHAEVFAENKLGEAVIRLYELYAESLPEGAERTRAFGIAEINKAYLGPIDYERFVPCLAPDVVQHDHRHVGSGTLSGADEVADATRVTVIELTENITGTLDGLLGLRPEGSLFHFTNTGTLRNSGGAFERNTWELLLHDDAGLLKHWERFDSKDADKALTRFEELTQEKPATTQQRRIKPNLVTQFMERWIEETGANNWTAVRALAADDYQEIDHPNGITFSADELVSSIERLYRSDEPYAHYEVLATLGPYLYLGWRQYGASGAQGRRYHVGPYEHKVLQVLEANENGLGKRGEIFAENKLGDALVRLYELYAEKMPEDRERQKWLRLAEGMSHANGKLDIDRMAPNFAPDMQMVDHRVVGVGTLQGAEAVSNALNMIVTELAENVKGHIDDIRGLHENATLYLLTTTGTDRRSGGEFERQIWELMVSDDDGMLVHWERFEPEHLDRALARFDELTSEAHKTSPARRHIQPNAATKALDGCSAAAKKQDWDTLRTMARDDYVENHHPTASTYGRDAMVETIKRLHESENAYWNFEHLATLGPQLCLSLSRSGASRTPAGSRFDVGAYETHLFTLCGVDEQGLMHCNDNFAENKLGEAVARLYERYADLLPAGHEQQHSQQVAASIRALLTPFNMDVMGPRLATDIVFIDNRLLGSWHGTGKDEAVKHIHGLNEVADNIQLYDEDVLATEPNLLLVQRMTRGIERVGGGEYERPLLLLMGFDHQGLNNRWEFFDVGDEAKALARFDELATPADEVTNAEPSQDKIGAYFANDAIRCSNLQGKRFLHKDWSGFAKGLAENVHFSDRRPMLRVEFDGREQCVAFYRQTGDLEQTQGTAHIHATRGERLALLQVDFEVADGDIGPSQISILQVIETNDAGECIAIIRFEPEDLDAAYAELDERYSNGEGAAYPTHFAWYIGWRSAFEARDWDRLAQLYSDDLIATDHRLVSWGELRDPTIVAKAHSDYVELAPDLKVQFEHIRNCTRGILNQSLWFGTRDGGEFENSVLNVVKLNNEGRLCRLDLYDLNKFDEALARFEGLSAESTSPTAYINTDVNPKLSSLIKRFVETYHQCAQTDKWEPLAVLCKPDMDFHDARHMSQLKGDAALMLAGIRERAISGAVIERLEFMQAHGDSAGLGKILWAGGPPDGRFEIEFFVFAEFDESGLFANLVFYDLDDEDKARALLEGFGDAKA